MYKIYNEKYVLIRIRSTVYRVPRFLCCRMIWAKSYDSTELYILYVQYSLYVLIALFTVKV
jgi:hypothetical protein